MTILSEAREIYEEERANVARLQRQAALALQENLDNELTPEEQQELFMQVSVEGDAIRFRVGPDQYRLFHDHGWAINDIAERGAYGHLRAFLVRCIGGDQAQPGRRAFWQEDHESMARGG